MALLSFIRPTILQPRRAEDWSGLKGRVAEAKFFSQPGRRADGIAQFHRPAILQPRRGRGLVWSGLKGGLAMAKFFYQSARPAGGAEAFPPDRRMALLSFIRRTILQPGLAGGGTSGLADAPAGLNQSAVLA